MQLTSLLLIAFAGFAAQLVDGGLGMGFGATSMTILTTWAMLAPVRQTDRDGYDEFWSSMESVDTKDITVDEEAGTVDVTLIYHPKDRDESSEAQSYRLIRIDGDLMIAD